MQIFFPLLPGVQSIWEPAIEEVEEALDKLRDGMDEGMEVFKTQAEGVQKEFEESRKQAYNRWKQLVKEVKRRSEGKDKWEVVNMTCISGTILFRVFRKNSSWLPI